MMKYKIVPGYVLPLSVWSLTLKTSVNWWGHNWFGLTRWMMWHRDQIEK